MRTLLRYLRLLRAQAAVSTAGAMQYRADFLVRGFMSVFWLGIAMAPLLVVFRSRESVAGWSYPEALVVLGWFSLLKSILDGSVSPSLQAVVEGVRSGALDFVLLKPADAQFLVSTARFEPWRLVDAMAAILLLGYAFYRLGRWPHPADVGVAAVLLVVAVLLLYAIWILVVSASFRVVRVDNLSYLFGSIFDAGRWPIHVFRGTLRFIFTVIFPLALMTTYPAQALLGRLSTSTAALVAAGGLVFTACARLVWRSAIRFYTSASS